MNMNEKKRLEAAEEIRKNGVFGAMTPEELSALPGSETEKILEADGFRTRYFEIRPDAPLSDRTPLIINFHGGGFVKGRSGRDRRYCSFLAEQLSCLVWDVDYVLAPEHPFPEGVMECYHLMQYAFAHAAELGIDRDRIAAAGHSAGGNLAAASMLLAAKEGTFRPACMLMEYFPTDQSRKASEKLSKELALDPWWVKRAKVEEEYAVLYCKEEETRNPLCSPLLADRELLSRFPASLIISAGKDTLLQETEEFAGVLSALGVSVEQERISEAVHGFTTNRTDGWERALRLHVEFFRRHFEQKTVGRENCREEERQ